MFDPFCKIYETVRTYSSELIVCLEQAKGRIETTYTQVTCILSVCANWWNSNSDLCANVFERPCTCKGRGGVRHLHSGGDMFAPGHTSTVLRSTVHCPGTNSARIHLT